MIDKRCLENKDFSLTLNEMTQKLNFVKDVLFACFDDSSVAASVNSLNGAAYIIWEIANDIETINDALCPDKSPKPKPESTFRDPRFWEYVAQINIDGHNPTDILEAWLKENNPDFLKDD